MCTTNFSIVPLTHQSANCSDGDKLCCDLINSQWRLKDIVGISLVRQNYDGFTNKDTCVGARLFPSATAAIVTMAMP